MVLDRLGVTLNTMTLGGLAIAIGEVVDDAVIDVENIVRRLRENRPLAAAAAVRPRRALDASLEVRSAVVYATFAVLLVFVPILTLSGLAGRLFAPLGIAYIFAILASLLVALTVTPALAMALLPRRRLPPQDPPWCAGRAAAMRRCCDSSRGSRARSSRRAAAFTIAGCAALPFFGGSFIPELKEGHFIVHMSAVPGTSLDESLRIGAPYRRGLRQLPAVRSVAQRVGRAEQSSEDTWGAHYSEFEVDLKPDCRATRPQTRRRICAGRSPASPALTPRS